MKMTTKGQVTIPLAVREHLGLLPHTEVEIYVRGDVAVIARAGSRRRGEALIEHLRGRGESSMTTDEIITLMRGTEQDD